MEDIQSVSREVTFAAESTEAAQEAAPLVMPEGKRASLRRAIASAMSFIPSATPGVEPAVETIEASQVAAPLLTLEGAHAAAASLHPDVEPANETSEAFEEATPLAVPQGKRASLRRAIASAASLIPSVTADGDRAVETAEAAQEVAPHAAPREATALITPERATVSPRSTSSRASLIPSVTPDVVATTKASQESTPLVTAEGKRASVRRAIASAISLIPSATPDVELAVEKMEVSQEAALLTPEWKHAAVSPRSMTSAVSLTSSVTPGVDPAGVTTEASQEVTQLVEAEGKCAAAMPGSGSAAVSHTAVVTTDIASAAQTTEGSQEGTPFTLQGKRASLRRALASAVSFIPSAAADVQRADEAAEAAHEVAPLVTLEAEHAAETTEDSQEATPLITPEPEAAPASLRSTISAVSLIPSFTPESDAPEVATAEAFQEATPCVSSEGKRASLRRAIASAMSFIPAVAPDFERADEAAEAAQESTPLVPPDADFTSETSEAPQGASPLVTPARNHETATPRSVTTVIPEAATAVETTEASDEVTPLVTAEGKRASLRRAIASAVSVIPSAETFESSQESSQLVARKGKRATLLRAITSAVPLLRKHVELDSSVGPELVDPETMQPEAVEHPAPAASEAFRALADQKLAALAMKQEEWGSTAPLAKAQLLSEIQAALQSAQDDLPDVSNSCVRVQGFSDPNDSAADDAWCSEQMANAALVTGFAKKMETTFKAVAKNGMCPAPKAVRRAPDGREVADVFPLAEDKRNPKKDWRVEVWMQEGKEATQGAALAKRPRAGSCGLVLGAGTVGALAVMDSLHLLFQCNTVVLLKMHPLRTYQEPFIRTVLAPLIALGVFDTIVEESGVHDAAYLVNHPLLCQLHMTGASETHDAIVWGPRREREGRRQRKEPVLDLGKVTVTSELGCITPYMICPAVFTEAELQYHAQHLATAVAANNSYSCNSPKVVLLAEDWNQREAFVDKLRKVFGAVPNPPAYYPGSDTRYAGFASSYTTTNFEKIQGPGFAEHTECARLPWTLVHTTADASNLAASADEYAFSSEAFCPLLTVCVLKGTKGPAQFLESAAKLCNEYIWGSLSCSLIVHPSVERSCPEDLEKAIANLQYGSVVLNSWSGEAYGMNAGVWGGYAGDLPALEQVEDIQSGVGMVNNCLLFDYPAKAVVRAPFLGSTKVGCGKPSTRAHIVNLTNFVMNPTLLSKAKCILPRAFYCF